MVTLNLKSVYQAQYSYSENEGEKETLLPPRSRGLGGEKYMNHGTTRQRKANTTETRDEGLVVTQTARQTCQC